MKLLFIGDIFGEPGRRAVHVVLPDLVRAQKLDCVIANAENAAHGKGLTDKICEELFTLGVDVITSGNHIWDQSAIMSYISEHPQLLRPANYPAAQPGKGSIVITARNEVPVGVINVEGQLFVGRVNCPFQTVDQELSQMSGKAKVILVDMHAEATSEKRGMGWHLNGRVSAVMGTHTHVPTADAEILSGGTAYITDVGMTGPYESVIGLDPAVGLKRLKSHLPEKFAVAKNDVRFSAILIEIDEQTGKALTIERIEKRIDSP